MRLQAQTFYTYQHYATQCDDDKNNIIRLTWHRYQTHPTQVSELSDTMTMITVILVWHTCNRLTRHRYQTYPTQVSDSSDTCIRVIRHNDDDNYQTYPYQTHVSDLSNTMTMITVKLTWHRYQTYPTHVSDLSNTCIRLIQHHVDDNLILMNRHILQDNLTYDTLLISKV